MGGVKLNNIEELNISMYNFLKKYIKDEDLVQDIAEIFIQRKYAERYDPLKSSFKTFVNNYYKFIFGNINKKTKYLNTVGLIEGFNDVNNEPILDDVMIEKESLAKIFDYFTDEELDLMTGEVFGAELARRRGITRQAVNSKLKNRINKFKKNL